LTRATCQCHESDACFKVHTHTKPYAIAAKAMQATSYEPHATAATAMSAPRHLPPRRCMPQARSHMPTSRRRCMHQATYMPSRMPLSRKQCMQQAGAVCQCHEGDACPRPPYTSSEQPSTQRRSTATRVMHASNYTSTKPHATAKRRCLATGYELHDNSTRAMRVLCMLHTQQAPCHRQR
jgi:hypothetical protein